jgi:hyperosmotically inducible protein
MRRRLLLLFVLLALPHLAGCATIYKASVDERDVGTYADDGRIESTLRARLMQDDLVKLRDISVNAYNGNVYLVGEFETAPQKMRAVKIAHGVAGVGRVTVVPFPKREDPTCGTSDDLSLYAKIKASLVQDRDIWSTQVDIKVVQCNVVLLGLVASPADADAIVAHANAEEGVRTVQNLIRIVR